MKLVNLIALILLFSVTLSSQDIRVIHNGTEVDTEPVGDNQWIVMIENEAFLLLKEEDVRTLLKRNELLRAEIEHRDSIIASRERLIDAFEEYQSRADEHIAAQEQIITTADSLFRGYRSLYTDLRQLIASPRVGLNGGFGVVYLEKDTWRPIGMVGVEYHRWMAQFQIGRRYQGLVVGFRLPLWY